MLFREIVTADRLTGEDVHWYLVAIVNIIKHERPFALLRVTK